VTAEDDAAGQQAVAWARSTVDRAVQLFIAEGIVDGRLLEARPSWASPPNVVIAMVREKGAQRKSFWLICGADVPFDYLASSAATSAREAARHFGLKWHLEAARLRDSSHRQRNSEAGRETVHAALDARLEAQAESLLRLVADDVLWQHSLD
jgi:Domain of unknown function (DUF4826)